MVAPSVIWNKCGNEMKPRSWDESVPLNVAVYMCQYVVVEAANSQLKPDIATTSSSSLTLSSSFFFLYIFFHEWTQECKISSPAWKHQCASSIMNLRDLLFTFFIHLFTRKGITDLLLSVLPHSPCLPSCNWQPLPGHSIHIKKSLFPVQLRDRPRDSRLSLWVCAGCSAACDVLKHR